MAVVSGLARAALRRSPARIRHIRPVSPASASGLVAQVYQQAKREFGMLAPPLTLHSPVPELLAASWILLRENLIVDGVLPRATKEAIAAAVSAGNACPYCVEVHSAAVHSMTGDRSLRLDRPELVTEPGLRDAAVWARGGSQVRPVPFDDEQLAEAIGVASTFHYINRMVSVFLPESPLPTRLPATARATAGRLLGWQVRSIADGAEHPAGRSLQLLPAAGTRPAPGWARANPRLADAFTRAGAAFDRAAESYVADPVRELVHTVLAGWDGSALGLDRSWLDDPVAELSEQLRAAGKLAVATALAAYRVDSGMVADYRRTEPSDAALLSLTGWASLQAADRAARRHETN